MDLKHVKAIALDIIAECGLINLSREDLADRAGFLPDSFFHITGMSFFRFVEALRKEGHIGPANLGPHTRPRSNPKLRKDHILRVATELAREIGYAQLTRLNVSLRAGCSESLVSLYFKRMDGLRNAVTQEGLAKGVVEIIAQGLANQADFAKNAPESLKKQAVLYLTMH